MSETPPAMLRESLLDYFGPGSRPSDEPAIVWRKGYRRERWSYSTLLGTARGFARELEARNIAKGDRVLLWGENSGEWIAAFLGCIYRGAIAVPLDAIGEQGFAQRVADQAGVRLAVVGGGLPAQNLAPQIVVLDDLPQVVARHSEEYFAPAPAHREDPVEIVFTSGTTAEPRGVVLTHGNILANLAPIEKGFDQYRRYERFFHPIRILDLLPLSHVFGQFLGIFLPQVFGATVLFMDTLNPAEVIREIHDERVWALVAVPRLIESLQGHLERDLETNGQMPKFRRNFERGAGEHFFRRWWRFRTIRTRFGWRFMAMVSGGAALPAETENFWTRLGYAVIQGYGLTETTSLVSLNHPFRVGRGSIGKPMPGLEVKLSPEGEILVRGENIASGYWSSGDVAPAVDAQGWFHTGDLGERDDAGNLYFKGRSKNVIVTPEGLKVYPADLEAELRKEPGLRDCVVIGLDVSGNAQACAVLLVRDGNSADVDRQAAAIVRSANQRLAPFQQMRRWVVWRDQDFPRTRTQKPILAKIRAAAEAELQGRGQTATSTTSDLLARFSRGRTSVKDPLELSSIERVELISELEDRYQVDLSEADFSSAETTAAMEHLLESPPRRTQAFQYPMWPFRWPARALRAIIVNCLALPAVFLLGWPRRRGREKLASAISGSANLVVANHVTYFDPAYVLAGLPRKIRRRLAVAMDGELLESMRTPLPGTNFLLGIVGRIKYFLLVSIFNVFPLPRQAGFQRSFAFMGGLIDRGWNVLVFPEGVTTKDGRMGPFRAGIGLLAMRLRVPVIPVYLGGLAKLKLSGRRVVALPGEIEILSGEPVRFDENQSPEKIAQELQNRVAALARETG
jgi:long-chain acyl-CoA synthetase